MIGFLRGKKTYFVAAGWIAWGIWTYAVERDPVAGTQRILEGVSLITLRAGVAKTQPSAVPEPVEGPRCTEG